MEMILIVTAGLVIAMAITGRMTKAQAIVVLVATALFCVAQVVRHV